MVPPQGYQRRLTHQLPSCVSKKVQPGVGFSLCADCGLLESDTLCPIVSLAAPVSSVVFMGEGGTAGEGLTGHPPSVPGRCKSQEDGKVNRGRVWEERASNDGARDTVRAANSPTEHC